MLRRRPRLSYANVVATMALFVALGGSSYAAVELSKGQVKKKHLAANSVVSQKVKDGSLLGRDFKAGELPAGEQGPAGPQGLAGAPGQRGPAGPRGAQGPKGDTGARGQQGLKGDQGNIFTVDTLPSGKTLRGAWHGSTTSASDHVAFASIPFPIPLASNVAVRTIESGAVAPSECPGTPTSPQAQPGYLCIWSGGNSENMIFTYGMADAYVDYRFGAVIWWSHTEAGANEAYGTWAVTAP
jgi:hypothetical protein